jgi:competence protein ComEC
MGLFSFLLAYGAGLFSAPFFPYLSSLIFVPPVLATLWLTLNVAKRRANLLLSGFFFTLALVLYHVSVTPPGDTFRICSFAGSRPVMVEGRVVSISERLFGRSAIDLEARLAGSEGIVAPVRGRVRLYLDEPAPELVPGQRIRFRSRLRLPRRFGTPGEYDFPRHLAFQGIFTTAHLSRSREMVIFPPPPGMNPAGLIETRRRVVSRFIDSHLNPSTAPLVKALLVGDKAGITPQQRDLMARGGISHLFAISGLHFALIAFFLLAGASALYRRSETLLLLAPPGRVLPVAILPLLLVYLSFTGSSLPTCRAFFMMGAGIFLFLFRRRTPPLKLLATTAFLLLLIEPLAFFEPSFQLSFAGLLGLLVFLPRWKQKFPANSGPLKWVATMVATTLAATIATTPLVLLHFHLAAPAGILTNLMAVPAIGLAGVPMGLAGALLMPFSPWSASLLMKGCGLIIQAVLQFVSWVVQLPGLGGWTIFCSPHQVIGAFLFCWGFFLPAKPSIWRFARTALPAVGAALLFLPFPSSPGLAVTALSVGQGDSILVSRPSGRNYLVDGGGLYSETFDVGERLVAPALGWLGVHCLEAVVLTHDHPDHRKGLLYVLENFPVKEFWSAVPIDKLHPSLREVLRRRRIPTVVFSPGWTTLESGKENALSVFVPRQEERDLNDNSLVFYTRLGREGVLLTGDLESRGVEELLASSPLPPVTLLKLPHHGSRHSAPERLFCRFRPRLLFVSAGRDNVYHLPHQKVVYEIRKLGLPLYRTDLQGTVRFYTVGEGWKTSHWQSGLFH